MRTYSHALLTHRAFRRLGPRAATTAALGAILPDLPALAGGAWLAAKRLKGFSRHEFEAEVCARSLFARPDAALHSALPVLAALTLYASPGAGHRRANRHATFLLGWAGHVAADALTHATDARPILWPISNYRFRSPISYRERDRHAVLFTLIEHATLLVLARKTTTNPPTP